MRQLSTAIRRLADRLRESPEGQTLVEYGLIASMISVIVVLALTFLSPFIVQLFSNTARNLQ